MYTLFHRYPYYICFPLRRVKLLEDFVHIVLHSSFLLPININKDVSAIKRVVNGQTQVSISIAEGL